MTVDERVTKAAGLAIEVVPSNIRNFMRLRSVNQDQLGHAIGLDQTKLSYRLRKPESLSYVELVKIAAFFGVAPATLFKQPGEAVADLFASSSKVGEDLVGYRALAGQAA